MRPLMLRRIDLFEVGDAKLLLRHVASMKNTGRRNAHEHTDNSNDDQDLDQREGSSVSLMDW